MNYTDKLEKYAKELKVLFVDDEEMSREVVHEILEDFFQSVDTAINGEDALRKYENKKYDIVITDITMPVVDGIELTQKIREINEEQKVIILSSHGDSDYLPSLTKMNVDGFVQKPVGKSLFPVLYKVSKYCYMEKYCKKL